MKRRKKEEEEFVLQARLFPQEKAEGKTKGHQENVTFLKLVLKIS